MQPGRVGWGREREARAPPAWAPQGVLAVPPLCTAPVLNGSHCEGDLWKSPAPGLPLAQDISLEWGRPQRT